MKQSRRQLLKGSFALGGISILPGCNFGTSESSSNESLNATHIAIEPRNKTLEVWITFTEAIQSRIESAGISATDLVSFSQTPDEKTVESIDNDVDGGKQLHIRAKGVVTTTTEPKPGVDRTNVSTEEDVIRKVPIVEMQLSKVIEPGKKTDWESIFSVSVEEAAKKTGIYSDNSETDAFIFPFQKTCTRILNSTSEYSGLNLNPGRGFKKIWSDGYNPSEFPDYNVAAPDRGTPRLEFYNNRPFIPMQNLVESKRELLEHVYRLFGQQDVEEASAAAWKETRELVGTTLRATASIAAPVDVQSAREEGTEVTAALLFGKTVAQNVWALNTVESLLTTHRALTEAGDEWIDALMQTVANITGDLATTQLESNLSELETLQQFESETILPAVTLFEPAVGTRTDAHRVYDKHLDAERMLLYNLIDALAESWAEATGSETLPNVYSRRLLYTFNSDSNQDMNGDFVDVTAGRAKLHGKVARDVDIGSLEPAEFIENGAVATDHSRLIPEQIGYNQEFQEGENEGPYYDGVNTLTPVGQVYRELLINDITGISDNEFLKDAKFLLHVLSTIDMILKISRLQQSALQATTNLYSAETYDCRIPVSHGYTQAMHDAQNTGHNQETASPVRPSMKPSVKWHDNGRDDAGGVSFHGSINDTVLFNETLFVATKNQVLSYGACNGSGPETILEDLDLPTFETIETLAIDTGILYVGGKALQSEGDKSGLVVAYDVVNQDPYTNTSQYIGDRVETITLYDDSVYVFCSGNEQVDYRSGEFARYSRSLSEQWRLSNKVGSVDDRLTEPPAINEHGIVLSGSNRLYMFTHQGNPIGENPRRGGFINEPAILNGRDVFQFDETTVRHFDLETGEEFVENVYDALLSPGTLVDGILHIGTRDGILVIDTADMSDLTLEIPGDVFAAPIVSRANIYAVTEDGVLRAWDRESKEVEWTMKDTIDIQHTGTVKMMRCPFLAGGKFYIAQGYDVYALE